MCQVLDEAWALVLLNELLSHYFHMFVDSFHKYLRHTIFTRGVRHISCGQGTQGGQHLGGRSPLERNQLQTNQVGSS